VLVLVVMAVKVLRVPCVDSERSQEHGEKPPQQRRKIVARPTTDRLFRSALVQDQPPPLGVPSPDSASMNGIGSNVAEKLQEFT